MTKPLPEPSSEEGWTAVPEIIKRVKPKKKWKKSEILYLLIIAPKSKNKDMNKSRNQQQKNVFQR